MSSDDESDALSYVSSGTSQPNTPPQQPEVGLSNAQLSSGRRKMLDLINRLLNTGVQLDIDIPRIAVIGNQSSGKSSLIEAISGTTLPRASGTCTRCPTECRLMRSSEPWKCVVSLRILTDSTGQVLGQARNELFGPPIYNKAEVEDRIRRAQLAILNPSIPRKEILEGDGYVDNVKSSSFSANCVSLEISGPDVADLAFCDLPGLIRSTSDGNSRDIELIEGMVESYIKKPSCIILLTVSCETDFMNQGALHLAKKFDPNGDRTVGVLTKPDRIESGDENDWLGFIRGETQQLRNGWFCVKQPSTSDLNKGITWSEARTKENDFFSMTTPWCELELVHQRYLRTSNLVGRLSTILSDLIAKRLPEIRQELNTAIERAQSSLRHLPKAPSADPLNEISTIIFTSRRMLTSTWKESLIEMDFSKQFALIRRLSESRSVGLRPTSGLTNAVMVSVLSRSLRSSNTRKRNSASPRREMRLQPFILRRFSHEWTIRALESSRAPPLYCRRILLTALVEKHFGEFGQGQLQRQVSNIVQDHLRQRYESTKERLEWLVDLERRPNTSNNHYFSDYRDKFFAFYKGIRQQDKNTNVLNGCFPGSDEAKEALSSLASLGFQSLGASDLTRLLPNDEMEPALRIMAEVRAYFQVAYKRFADNVPLVVDYELIRGAERGLLSVLFKELGIHSADGPEICRDFAQENVVVADKREELNKKLERLQTAGQQLTKL
ncbi:hypothetical protein PM082_015335 [Marasmius tenuissimus]|nr:hypothetical protein PM082_015335 [Marasmius tenuissimus]